MFSSAIRRTVGSFLTKSTGIRLFSSEASTSAPKLVPFAQEYGPEITELLKKYQLNKERRGSITGTVVNTKSAKTIIIRSLYHKYIPKYQMMKPYHRRFMAHDEKQLCRLGDLVRIIPGKKRGLTKRHELLEIVKRPQLFKLKDGTVLSQAGKM